MTHEPFDESDLSPTAVPRRWLLRAIGASAVGAITLVGLAACGGGEGGGDGGGEEEEEGDD